jgi:hypothetical protein
MAITSVFYDGVVTEVGWAKAHPHIGSSEYGVHGPGDFKVTAHPSTPFAVNVAPGNAWGYGVYDESDSIVTVTCDAPSAGTTRWDLIAVRRNWQPAAGGPTVIVKVNGDTTMEIPSGRENSPGILDDQPIYLVQWTAGQTQPTTLVDLRCWASNGGVFAKDDLVRTYLSNVGTRITIGSTIWSMALGANDIMGWVKESAPAAKTYAATDWQSGAIPISTSPDGSTIKLASITIPDPGFPYHVQVLARMEGGKATTRWDADVSIAGQPAYVAVASLGNTVAPWYDITGFTINPITGASTVDLNLRRLSGTESFGLTAYNRAFRVMVIPAAT